MGGKGYHLLTYVAAEIIVNYIQIIILNLILLLLTCVSKTCWHSNQFDQNMYSNSNFVKFRATEMFLTSKWDRICPQTWSYTIRSVNTHSGTQPNQDGLTIMNFKDHWGFNDWVGSPI